jgi:hypothetical protein
MRPTARAQGQAPTPTPPPGRLGVDAAASRLQHTHTEEKSNDSEGQGPAKNPEKMTVPGALGPNGDLTGGERLAFLSPVSNKHCEASPYDWGYSPRWVFDGEMTFGRPELNLQMALAKTFYKLEGWTNLGETPDPKR